jgi:hypothetical protein
LVREQCIDRNRLDGIVGRFDLLDDADAIDPLPPEQKAEAEAAKETVESG